MSRNLQIAAVSIAVIALIPAVVVAKKTKDTEGGEFTVSLWRNPDDIASRNLFYGPGGKQHEPRGAFTFVKEDLGGTYPKFTVRADDGSEWKVKLGPEARSETAATRLVWAVGYFTDEDYFVPFLRVKNLPAKLHRGAKLVGADGSVHDARLERKSEKKIGNWRWRENPFSGTRELDGLRVMMALLNNFDLKDDNNAIYNSPCDGDSACPMHTYVMADLGATFGATHQIWPHHARRGDLDTYSRSTFIRKVTPDYVNFGAPSRPLLFNRVPVPLKLFTVIPPTHVIREMWIGKHIPRDHARWIGQLLGRLSHTQVRDAFRAAAYSPQEVEGFSRVVESRIADLNEL